MGEAHPKAELSASVKRGTAYRWLSGVTPAAWERFRQDLRDCGVTDVGLPG